MIEKQNNWHMKQLNKRMKWKQIRRHFKLDSINNGQHWHTANSNNSHPLLPLHCSNLSLKLHLPSPRASYTLPTHSTTSTNINGINRRCKSHHHHHQKQGSKPPPLMLMLLLFMYFSTLILAQSFSMDNLSTQEQSRIPQDTGQSTPHYIEYNLADYCSEKTWSDYPGRHRIRLEKAVKIRQPSIVDFHFNDTHRQHLGGGVGGRPSPFGPQFSLIESPSTTTTLVPYCLLSFYTDFGYRIYAEGFATGVENGGKNWFTETLHFKGHSQSETIGTGLLETTTQKDTLSLIFEQLNTRRFSFHLVITPFRDSMTDHITFDHCDSSREYKCRNERCIAKYLTCDHHNNCGDYSDEGDHCLSKVPKEPFPTQLPPPQEPYDFDGQPSPEVPTFDINGNRIDFPIHHRPPDSDIPEYVDVPLPTDHPFYVRHNVSTKRPFQYDTMNGIDETGTIGAGGFLEDLFTFSSSSKVSSVVYVVRYLLVVLVIIILVTLVNFLIWCLITKRDQSFMAPAASPTPTLRPQQPATSTMSVISDV